MTNPRSAGLCTNCSYEALKLTYGPKRRRINNEKLDIKLIT